MFIFETIFATILLQTFFDRIKWSDNNVSKSYTMTDDEEASYPRYDEEGNLIEHPPGVDTEEEETLEEDGGILNATQTSQSSVAPTILFPQTMQMQREIFVLKGDYITPQDAESFFEQAQRLPHAMSSD